MQLKVLTYNTLFAGRDGADTRRAAAQIGLVRELEPDVFLMQEARGFDANGGSWLYDMEHLFQMRGFLALAPRTGQHLAIFIRQPLRPLSFESDPSNFHHSVASLRVALPGIEQSLHLTSVHLCPNGVDVRRREAAYLAVQATPGEYRLLAGDFNSASPHDPEPRGFDLLAAHHRIRYAGDGRHADRTVLATLETAGWVDVGHLLQPAPTPTVPTAAYTNAEFAQMRCDYVLATPALASKAVGYQVIRTPATDSASDHYPVLATFEI
ncbi:endonuclease/exonuclease/phosphatase family metal-dependent hydrolase [Pseudomonas citronellolis]|uniref:endonuclease/exonuclease/phosphatase family protein n=1 Tax=Pseudomonas citronellolis TaxID=53408 RepID=UPI00209CA985|nr:endonuclease/exonuclease/phosphatase family protein [Pseudomonas citronellolis]MCP1645645.1 endonuclease/exonuclease/phosphatase family metal-dependent hydrolase [Pseudomonas citronellolis]MCP1667483.1 endonuclease/exonuclease/phosphatase family metal-dependent hydrolase [Pseudomonas citronellolis]MCP1699917.1 endonuclease/exonuclease/phosphatase family metal-dependent hydrolase [Pseudomonas citronellolis]MCP1705359.1 endonuclease/exonuclease/phosphatase family metal-dependent hydrolase [Pse